MAETVTIEALGQAGDGIASGPSGPIYVSYALPGETALVDVAGERGRVLELATESPDRVAPFCPYFGRCGGCVAQHLGAGLYADWKVGKVRNALSLAGISADVGPLQDAHGEGRRRVTFHGRLIDGAVQVGFMAARSHDLVSIDRCPITVSELADASRIAAILASDLARLRKPLDVAVTATASGLDIDLRGSGPIGEGMRQRLIRRAEELDLARLSLHGDALIERRPPILPEADIESRLPPGAFVQATAAGQAALTDAIVRGCGPARRVLDLFAGTGPFSLQLARSAEVHAVDGDAAMLAALDRAARAALRLRRITTETRDLFRRPLLPPELGLYDAIVLDPPRSGAEAQVRQIAQSAQRRVVMASCDPGTFARDAAILIAAGFALGPVLPIDQFKWSAHLELVGTFQRGPAGRRRPRRHG